ncbi:DoxX family protein [Arthrospiribacter ruber]|uniref:DoxX family protein n=1 Tax=Arthrospiribacter ruber TaxID=2487934 RepID=A0A951M7I8_9BACT|nr:DoxX family protein [Arthrospiribacter ruber]MBW3466916.1 DoxX family protein [Arthrospiribacter ruber]
MNKNKRSTKIGWAISILISLMLMLDGVMKIIQPTEVIEATTQLGYRENSILSIGIILIIITILYLFPRTSFLGAILLTGFLGGAVATHFRIDNPLFSHQLFPVYLGIFIWLGVALRHPTIRQIFINPKNI